MIEVAQAIAGGRLSGRLWIVSNLDCNLACAFCLTASSPLADRRAMTADEMLRVAREGRDLGFAALGVTGGEPLLLPWVPEAVAEMAGLLPTVLLTNGTLLRGRRLEEALRAWAGLPIAVQLSLDHPDPATNDAGRGPGSHASVVHAARELALHGIRVRIATTAAGLPPEEWEALRRLARDLGVAEADHLLRPIARRGRAAGLGSAIAPGLHNVPAELAITRDGAFWSTFGTTVRDGRLDTDLLLTRRTAPLSLPVRAMLDVAAGRPPRGKTAQGFR